MGEVNSLMTMTKDNVVMTKGNSVSWQSEKGGVTWAASIQTTESEKFRRLVKVIGVHEYKIDERKNWKGKI